jgi:prophage regulatory protein
MEEHQAAQVDTWNDRIVMFPEVRAVTGLGRTTIWRMENEGTFPKRFYVSKGMIAWRKSDIERWIAGLGK